MITLVVDDLRIFPNKIGDNIVHHCLNATDALTFLEENFPLISEIFLDHDLGYNPKTKMFEDIDPVLHWLEEKFYNGQASHITALRIITANPVGAQKIAAIAKRYSIYIHPNDMKPIDWREPLREE